MLLTSLFMPHSELVNVLLVSPLLLFAQTQNSPQSDFTLRTNTQLVVLNVAVQDSRGANIRGLNAPAFQVYENGRPQALKQFTAEDRPVSVGILLDTSGSMRTKQAEAAAAALEFVTSSNPLDETFVVNFNDRPSLGLPATVAFSQDPAQIRRALFASKPDGRTSLYDALTLAAEHLAKAKWESKALLIISDGGDNNSTHTLADALNAVEFSGAVTYSIALYDPEEPEHDLGTLRRFAHATGGEMFTPIKLSEVRGLCRRIAQDIRASYMLAYTPPDPDRLDIHRQVKVVASSPATGKLKVRARSSYTLQKQ